MKITSIRRVKSYFEVATETAVYEIDGSFLRENKLTEGADADETLLQSLHTQSRERRAYERAQYLLDARDYSYAMLYRKLYQTYHDNLLCKNVCDRLVRAGLINDRNYAERCAEYLIERKKYGMFRARQEMLHRGLAKELVENALSGYEDTAEEQIPAVLEKKYGRILTDPKDYKTRQKVIAGMARLGYNFNSVKNAIDDYFASLEEDSGDE
jgi:SOS response regulatory protein OraA/RecX